jgi:hypothetical protein
MLFEIPKKRVLILAINVALNSFTQNLHLCSPHFVGKNTHSITNRFRALERGHELICLLAIEEELLGLRLEKELFKDIFNTKEEIFSLSKCL